MYGFLSDVLAIGDCDHLLYSAKAIAALRDYLPLVFSGSDGLPESVTGIWASVPRAPASSERGVAMKNRPIPVSIFAFASTVLFAISFSSTLWADPKTSRCQAKLHTLTGGYLDCLLKAESKPTNGPAAEQARIRCEKRTTGTMTR